jgi:hypothetical protein
MRAAHAHLMREPTRIEALLQDAIALLEANGFPMAAESLRDNLRAIRGAPTAAARRRRAFQLKELLEGSGPCAVGLTRRLNDERYRSTLRAIQEILVPAEAETDSEDWSPSFGRVA